MPTYRYDVNLSWNGSGSPGVNVWHIRTAGVNPGTIDVQDAVDALGAFYAAICEVGFLPAGWRAVGAAEAISVPDSQIEGVTGFNFTSLSQVATFSAPSMVCVGLRTSSATRSGRGRKFLGPIGTNAMDASGTLLDAHLQGIRAAADNLVDASDSANDWAIGVYSVSSSLLRDVVQMPVRDSIAVLRSRRD